MVVGSGLFVDASHFSICGHTRAGGLSTKAVSACLFTLKIVQFCFGSGIGTKASERPKPTTADIVEDAATKVAARCLVIKSVTLVDLCAVLRQQECRFQT